MAPKDTGLDGTGRKRAGSSICLFLTEEDRDGDSMETVPNSSGTSPHTHTHAPFGVLRGLALGS